jgi:hypothetical protein
MNVRNARNKRGLIVNLAIATYNYWLRKVKIFDGSPRFYSFIVTFFHERIGKVVGH